jgi:hypothetical protein
LPRSALELPAPAWPTIVVGLIRSLSDPVGS